MMTYIVHKTATDQSPAQIYTLQSACNIEAIVEANEWEAIDFEDENGNVDWKQVVDTELTTNGEDDTSFMTVFNVDTDEIIYGRSMYE